MLPGWVVIFSVLIRLISGGRYAWGVLNGKARPNPVTWFLWGLTPLIACAAQWHSGLTAQSVVLLALGISPLAVACIAVTKQGFRQHVTPFTVGCGLIALIGIVLWRVTTQPELAIICSILADIFATLPTLQKAYHDPASEYPLPYLLSMISMILTLLTIQAWQFTAYAFPLYMLGINLSLFIFARFQLKKLFNRRQKKIVAPESAYELQ